MNRVRLCLSEAADVTAALARYDTARADLEARCASG